jgi:hypothetical protein
MPRSKNFILQSYQMTRNPFPATPIVRWGGDDPSENGSIFSEDVGPAKIEEAIDKFIVGPIDSRSKFHFLWSLGQGDDARGFGKTATLHYLARTINRDLGFALLTTHEFDPEEAKGTPILAAMGTFNTEDVKNLAAVSREQVLYLAQPDPSTGHTSFDLLRARILNKLEHDGIIPLGSAADPGPKERSALEKTIVETDLKIGGKTLGLANRTFISLFAGGNISDVLGFLRKTQAKEGFELLGTTLIIARTAGVRRVFLLIDQVEDFANSEVPKKKRHLEVERFRDLAIETEPFGEMASYVLTMHPAAARSIEEFWALARLPKIDHISKQNERATVILDSMTEVPEGEKLLVTYMNHFGTTHRQTDELMPFDRSGVRLMIEQSNGRPGRMLEMAYGLIEEGAREHWRKIGSEEVIAYLRERGETTQVVEFARRTGLGTVE